MLRLRLKSAPLFQEKVIHDITNTLYAHNSKYTQLYIIRHTV